MNDNKIKNKLNNNNNINKIRIKDLCTEEKKKIRDLLKKLSKETY